MNGDPQIQIIQEQFWYNCTFAALAAAASSTAQINIQADADFIIIKSARFVTNDADESVVTAPQLTVLLTDTGSGRQLMDIATHIENIFGTAQFPYIYPQAKRLSANSTFQVQVSNIHPSVAYNVWMDFAGFKQYKFKNPNLQVR